MYSIPPSASKSTAGTPFPFGVNGRHHIVPLSSVWGQVMNPANWWTENLLALSFHFPRLLNFSWTLTSLKKPLMPSLQEKNGTKQNVLLRNSIPGNAQPCLFLSVCHTCPVHQKMTILHPSYCSLLAIPVHLHCMHTATSDPIPRNHPWGKLHGILFLSMHGSLNAVQSFPWTLATSSTAPLPRIFFYWLLIRQ